MHCGAKRTRFEESCMNPQNSTFLFIGFSIAWLIIIVYVISIALREKSLRQELDRVKRMVEENEQAKK
jgi:CcmD family protein